MVPSGLGQEILKNWPGVLYPNRSKVYIRDSWGINNQMIQTGQNLRVLVNYLPQKQRNKSIIQEIDFYMDNDITGEQKGSFYLFINIPFFVCAIVLAWGPKPAVVMRKSFFPALWPSELVTVSGSHEKL